MKINTVTFHGAHNYGAVLQAYALQRTLISLGYENEIIDYRVNKASLFESVAIKSPRKSITKIRNNILTLLRYKEYKQRFDRFEAFINKQLMLTRGYTTYEELVEHPPQADVYMAGSDQIWNWKITHNMFFLPFGIKETKRVSYAASMGTYDLNSEKRKLFGESIKNFEAISVRESDAAAYIKDNYGLDSQVHIDPVFLLKKDEWEKIGVDSNFKQKYILCYQLLFSPLLNDSLKKLKQSTGHDVIVITTNPRDKIFGDIYIRNAGPKEFLGLIKNAEYVVTTSFHGTCLSIIFEKKFYSFIRPEVETRITHITKKLNLENRIVSDLSQISCSGIRYDNVINILEEEKQKAIDYFRNIMDRKT